MSRNPDRLTAAFDQVKKDIRMLTNPKTYENLTQNQIIGGLTMLLLVVGAITGIYLGQSEQDLRQQAAIYDVCVRGDDICNGKTDGSSCGLGTCRLNEGNGECQCAHPTNTPTLGCDLGQEYLNLPTCLAGCGNQGSCVQRGGGYCCDPGPTNTPLPPDNGCAAGGGTCRAAGTCQAGEFQSGLCSGAGSGPVCCKPTGPTSTPACFGAGVACGNGNQGSDNCCPGLDCSIQSDNVARCVAPSICGDQACNGGETCSTCSTDCGACATNTPVPTGAQCESRQEFLNAATCWSACTGGSCTPGGIGYCCNPPGPTNTPVPTGALCESEQEFLNAATCWSACTGGSCTPGGIGYCCNPGNTPTNTPIVIGPTSTPTNTPVNPTNTPVNPTNTPVNPTNTPVGPTNTPVVATNTPIGPVCMSVTVNNPSAPTQNSPFVLNQSVTLTCGQVSGATRYEFRMKILANNTITEIDPSDTTPNVSKFFALTTGGNYVAQCRPCGGVSDTTCSPWMD